MDILSTRPITSSNRNTKDINVMPIVPHEMVLNQLKSTSAHILRKRQVEILPNEQTNFTFEGNNRIIFNISSSTEFLSGMDSYLKLKFKHTPDPNYPDSALAEGGAHSLFRSLEIRLTNGTLIERIDNYNTLYAIMSNATHDRDHVEWIEAAAGDSVSSKEFVDPYDIVDREFDIEELTGVLSFNAANTLLSTAGNFTDFAVGNVLRFTIADNVNNAQRIIERTILTITDDDNLTFVDPIQGWVDANTFTVLNGLYIKDANLNYIIPQRKLVMSGDEYTLSLKLMCGFLQSKTYLPLLFMKSGIQIVLELERPIFTVVSNKDYAVDNYKGSYTISEPRFMATMITPDDTVIQQYKQKYMEDGLHYDFMSYKHRLNIQSQGGSGSYTSNINFGVRSARVVFSVIKSPYSESTFQETNNYDSISTFLNTGLESYQYKSGAEEYPQRSVKCNDQIKTEAFQQLMLSTNQQGGTIWNVRFLPKQWRDGNQLSFGQDSSKFIVSTRLDRDNSVFTGLDLSINPLDLEFVFNKVFTGFKNGTAAQVLDRYIHTYVGYDVLVSISDAGVQVRS